MRTGARPSPPGAAAAISTELAREASSKLPHAAHISDWLVAPPLGGARFARKQTTRQGDRPVPAAAFFVLAAGPPGRRYPEAEMDQTST